MSEVPLEPVFHNQEKPMSKFNHAFGPFAAICLSAVLLFTGCSKPKSAEEAVRILPQGKQYSGFLSDYSQLTQNPNLENAMTYVRKDPQHNVHHYVAIIVDPVQIYVATNADPKSISERGRVAITQYFQADIENAVRSAYPIVTEPGPLVLRLRSALVGVDVGSPGSEKGDSALERPVNIGAVKVEMELVDSETGEQIAAAVDQQSVGDAVVGSDRFAREEKFRAATEAFDGWAARLRDFLDNANELSPEDIARTEKSINPY